MAQLSHPPSQTWVVAVGGAVTTADDEKHMEKTVEEERLCRVESDQAEVG